MKRRNYLWQLAILVFFLSALFFIGAAVPEERFGSFLLFGLGLSFVFAPLVIKVAADFQESIPNGLPRPEDELPRRKPFRVHSRIGNRLTLRNVSTQDDEKPVYWEFENLPVEVAPEKQVVYLDDLKGEYLVAWEKEGVIPILSAQGRAKTGAKIVEHQGEGVVYAEMTNM